MRRAPEIFVMNEHGEFLDSPLRELTDYTASAWTGKRSGSR